MNTELVVVGLNQTLDRTVRLPALVAGQVLRAIDAVLTPGGKAVNVCRAAKTLGAPARLVGPFPGRLGRLAAELLDEEGLAITAVPVTGELRGTTVIIEADGRTTVVNEPGPSLNATEWDAVMTAVAAAVDDGVFVAISGSAPPGAPDGTHHQLVELVHERRGTVAIDVTGTRLVEAAAAGADLVSPNLVEAEQALGGGPALPVGGGGEAVDLDNLDSGDVTERARAAAGALVDLGARAAIVSVGHHGVACRSADLDTFVPAPPSPSRTRSVPATLCSGRPSSPWPVANASKLRSAPASPMPPPPSPTQSPDTPTQRSSIDCGRRSVPDRPADVADDHRRSG